jgi:hypothetical protein
VSELNSTDPCCMGISCRQRWKWNCKNQGRVDPTDIAPPLKTTCRLNYPFLLPLRVLLYPGTRYGLLRQDRSLFKSLCRHYFFLLLLLLAAPPPPPPVLLEALPPPL